MNTIKYAKLVFGIVASVVSMYALQLSTLAAESSDPTLGVHDVRVGTGAITGRVQNAVSEQYLINVRVTVKGTDLVSYTDSFGTYRINNVPVGTATLVFFYTSLDPLEQSVEVKADKTSEYNILMTSTERFGKNLDVVKLDSFVVAGSRETDSKAIAINEQRFAPNIKNVVTSESFGEVVDGNVAEFIKFLPGVMGDFDTDEAASTTATISVRGFASNLTAVSTDGSRLANTSNATGTSRSFSFGQVSINNVSRVEVTKVPTPATPADSLAGSINMISKSAFERKSAQFRYRVSFTADSNALSLKKEPYPSDKYLYKVRPGFDFDYTIPISKEFGIVLTGLMSERFIEQYSSQLIYNAAGTGTGASVQQPYLQSYRLAVTPRFTSRASGGLRADWRLTPNAVLSFIGQIGKYESHKIANLWLFNAGTTGTATPATGTPMSFGESFTNGATGRGALTTSTAASVSNPLATTSGDIRYRFNNGDWKLDASVSQSLSKGGYRDTENGHFRQFGITNRNPVRISFSQIDDIKPNTISVRDNANTPVDFYDINNYALTTANSTPRDIRDDARSANVDVRKQIGGLPFPLSLQVGGAARTQERDARRQSITWTYNGPGGSTSPAPYLSAVYANAYLHYGFRGLPWVSNYKAWEAFRANPALFTKTPAQIVAEESFRITNSEYVGEDVTAYYVQSEMRFFKNRLQILMGVRYENTDVKGQGVLFDPNAVYVRTSAGAFARNATGQRIRKPEAGAVGSMDELRLIRRERGYVAQRSYDGYYPSIHLTMNLKEDLLLRAAYAKTYGRPDFTEIVPNSTINEADLTANPSQVPGTIDVRNTGLRPWTADNYDLSLEYYTKQGGLFTAGLFLKKIKNFFSSFNQIATAGDLDRLGLEPEYLGWRLTTKINGGDAEVAGAEFSVTQSLQGFGTWGKYFEVFVNGTYLNLKGDRDSDFNNFVPKSASWGVTFRKKPFTLLARWNYRGEQRRTSFPALGPDAYEYQGGRLILDLNAGFQLQRNLELFVNAQNVFQEPLIAYRYGSSTPEYAKRPYLTTGNGIQFTAGVRGSF